MFVVGRHHNPHAFAQHRRSNPAWPWLLATGVVAAAAGSAGYLYCQPRRLRSVGIQDPAYKLLEAEIQVIKSLPVTDALRPSPEQIALTEQTFGKLGPAQYQCVLEYAGCFQGVDSYEVAIDFDGQRMESKRFADRSAAEAYFDETFGTAGANFRASLEAGNRPGQPMRGEFPEGIEATDLGGLEASVREAVLDAADDLRSEVQFGLTEVLLGVGPESPAFPQGRQEFSSPRVSADLFQDNRLPPILGIEAEAQVWKIVVELDVAWTGRDGQRRTRTASETGYVYVSVIGVPYPTTQNTFQSFVQTLGPMISVVSEGPLTGTSYEQLELAEKAASESLKLEVPTLWLFWKALRRNPNDEVLLAQLDIMRPVPLTRVANPLRAPLPVMHRPSWGQLPHIGTAPQFQPPEFPPMRFKRLRNARTSEPDYRSLTACNNFCRQRDGLGNPIRGTWDYGSVNCGEGGICYDFRPRSTASPRQSLLALPSSSLTTSARGIKSSLRTSRRRKRRTGLSTRLTRASRRSRR